MAQLTNKELENLTTPRLLALYKARCKDLRKAKLYGPKEDLNKLINYTNSIKRILDTRGNVEK